MSEKEKVAPEPPAERGPTTHLLPLREAALTRTNTPPERTFFEAVGGHETFRTIVAEFYRRVRDDDILYPLYPEDDLAEAERRLLLFLEQYWGGPRHYAQERGHPRLRIRHAPFPITEQVAARWLHLMRQALDTVALSPEEDRQLWNYLERAATFLINSPEGKAST